MYHSEYLHFWKFRTSHARARCPRAARWCVAVQPRPSLNSTSSAAARYTSDFPNTLPVTNSYSPSISWPSKRPQHCTSAFDKCHNLAGKRAICQCYIWDPLPPSPSLARYPPLPALLPASMAHLHAGQTLPYLPHRRSHRFPPLPATSRRFPPVRRSALISHLLLC